MVMFIQSEAKCGCCRKSFMTARPQLHIKTNRGRDIFCHVCKDCRKLNAYNCIVDGYEWEENKMKNKLLPAVLQEEVYCSRCGTHGLSSNMCFPPAPFGPIVKGHAWVIPKGAVQEELNNIEQEFVDDICEVLNNLEDDLQLDIPKGESGAASYKDAYAAVKKYAQEVLKQKLKKWKR